MKNIIFSFKVLCVLVFAESFAGPAYAQRGGAGGDFDNVEARWAERERRAREAEARRHAEELERQRREAAERRRQQLQAMIDSVGANEAATHGHINNEISRIRQEWIAKVEDLSRDVVKEDLLLFFEEELEAYIDERIQEKLEALRKNNLEAEVEQHSQVQDPHPRNEILVAKLTLGLSHPPLEESAIFNDQQLFDMHYAKKHIILVENKNKRLLSHFGQQSEALEAELFERSLHISREIVEKNDQLKTLRSALHKFVQDRIHQFDL